MVSLLLLLILATVLMWSNGTTLWIASGIWAGLVIVLALVQFERSRRVLLRPLARLIKRA
jgi:hypothetical protein